MVENNLLGNAAAEHHGNHHGATVHEVHSDDGNIHLPESTHEGNKHDEHQEVDQPTERKDVMKSRISQTAIGLALSIVFVLGLSGNFNPQAADLDLNNLEASNLNLSNLELNNLDLNNLQAASLNRNNLDLNNLGLNSSQVVADLSLNDLNLNGLERAKLNLNNLDLNDFNLSNLDLNVSST